MSELSTKSIVHYALVNDQWEIPNLSVNGMMAKAVLADRKSAEAMLAHAPGHHIEEMVIISKELADSLKIC